MKNSETFSFVYEDRIVHVRFRLKEMSRELKVGVILDVSRDDIPVGVELFGASEMGQQDKRGVIEALASSNLRFSYDEEIDILTININFVDEDPVTQRPGSVKFGFDACGEIVSMSVQ